MKEKGAEREKGREKKKREREKRDDSKFSQVYLWL